MTANFANHASFALGPFIIEPSSGRVLLGGDERQIQPKIMQLLLCLVDNYGQIVSGAFLLEHVWPGVFVDGSALRRAVYMLRKALDAGDGTTAIETLPKRGYRLHLIPTALSPSTDSAATVTPQVANAYRGLRVFDVDHSSVFFGRTTLIDQACEAISRQLTDGRGFLVLLGASGSGKSSLARAGVIPQLIRQAAQGGATPEVLIFEAGKGAQEPLHKLVQALLTVFGSSGQDVHGFMEQLAEGPEQAVARLIGAKASGGERSMRLIMLFDQFEQLLTPAALSDEVRDAIFAIVYALARSGVVQIVVTMRSEFYPQLANVESLRFLKGRHGVVDVIQPGAAEIADIVRRPAQLAGLTFEQRADGKRLDVALIDEATKLPNSLPLLQFVLRELELASSESKQLRFAEFEALGGLLGCLSRHAERVFGGLSADEQQVLPQVLSQTVTADPRDASRLLKTSVPLSDFDSPQAQSLIGQFVDARLMVSFLDPYSNEPSVEIVHEAVLQYWDRARDWAERSYADIRFRSWMTELSDKWRSDNEAEAYLLRDGKLLADAESLMGRDGFFDANQQRFVRASLKRSNRAGNLRRGVVALLAVLLGVSTIMGYQATRSSERAEQALGRANETSEFLSSIFADADPGAKGKELTAIELLETAKSRLAREPLDDSLAQADALRGLGESFRRLNRYAQAESMYVDAYEAVGDQRDEAPRLAAQVSLEMAGLRREQERHDEARAYALEALESAKLAGNEFLIGQSQNMLGMVAWRVRAYDESLAWLGSAAATLEQAARQSDKYLRLLVGVYQNQGLAHTSKGDYESGAAAYERAKLLLKSRGLEASSQYALLLNNYGVMRRYQGHHAESAEIFRDAIALRLQFESLSYPAVVSLYVNLASSLMSLKDYTGVLETVETVLTADLTYAGYFSTSLPQLYVRRVSAQQLSGLPSSLQDIQKAREGIEVLKRELNPRSSMPLESEMAVAVALWERGDLSGQSLTEHCQETRQLIAEQAERQSKNPRLIEFDTRLRAFLENCPAG